MAVDKTFNDVKVNMTLQPQSVRANLLSTQEDLAVQMGKIQKWYTDLRREAWDGTSRNDLLVSTKTFTDFIGNTQFYFGYARPTNFDTPMLLRYRIKVWVPNNANYIAYSDVTFNALAGGSIYNAVNTMKNTSYRPVYYHYWLRPTSTGFNNGYGNVIGIGLNDSTRNTDTSLKRSCTIDILECVNCTFTFFDDATAAASVPGYGADPANYGATNASFNGNQTVPDNNNYERLYVNERPRAGTNGVKQYSLCAYNKDGKLESFTTTSGTGTSKAFYTTGKFQAHSGIYYYAGNSNIAADSVIGSSVLYSAINTFDMRYSANVTTTAGFTAWAVLYLEIAFDSDGYWSPTATGFTHTPTSGHYYIQMGVPVNTYQMPIDPFHPIYYYDGTNLIDADLYRAQQSIPSDTITGTGTVGSIAKFTDTHEIGDATWTPNTPTTCNISQGVLTFTAGTAASLS